MKLSCIIPTHNRAQSLRRALESIVPMLDEADAEVVVVNNNSTDETQQVAESFGQRVRVVFEGRTAFTRARSKGGQEARGDVLLYLDDDVIVENGSLAEVNRVFAAYSDAGVLAGRIEPQFEVSPPDWVIACQATFNGLSIYSPANFTNLGTGFQEVQSAAGPMMAIRREAYEAVGGFPPDTIGVETNTGGKSFRKLYVGPGDYGLCCKVRDAGWKVYYSPVSRCRHVIPPIRCTVAFWRSRMIGEGQYVAITNRVFFKKPAAELATIRNEMAEKFRMTSDLLRYFYEQRASLGLSEDGGFEGMHPDELWLHYSKSYLEMDALLEAHSDLGEYLWQLARDGVSDADFQPVLNRLPPDFKALVLDGASYDNEPYSFKRLPPASLGLELPATIQLAELNQQQRDFKSRLRGALRRVAG
jgi:glycosyltransferase involved in cell wall biosynthesis